MTIYGPLGTRRTVGGLIAAMQPMAEAKDKLAAIAQTSPNENIKVIKLKGGKIFNIGKVTVSSVVKSHYILTDKNGECSRSLAFRFDMPDRSIVYTGDTGPSAAIELLAQNVDVLVCEIMMPERTLAKFKKALPDVPEQAVNVAMRHYRNQRISPKEAGLMAGCSKAKALVLTHIGMENKYLAEAKAVIEEKYDGSVTFVNDLDSI